VRRHADRSHPSGACEAVKVGQHGGAALQSQKRRPAEIGGFRWPKPFDTSSAFMQLGEQDLVGWSRLNVSDAAHIVCNAGTAMKCHESPTNE
jgi:hypothetical protein